MSAISGGIPGTGLNGVLPAIRRCCSLGGNPARLLEGIEGLKSAVSEQLGLKPTYSTVGPSLNRTVKLSPFASGIVTQNPVREMVFGLENPSGARGGSGATRFSHQRGPV
jgi:hypothetical protein